jgi:valyl-tRNA synthetase
LELADRWILSRFQKTAEKVNQSLEEYNLAQASRAMYQFVWSEFCDWYVELSKIRLLGNASVQEKETALRVLETILDGILRLLHPIMPFITEELWKRLAENLGVETIPASLLLVSYPRPDSALVNDEAEKQMGKMMNLITAVRTIRSEMNVPPGRPIALSLNVSDDPARVLMETHSAYLRHLCKIGDLKIGSSLPKPPKSVSVVVEGMEAFIPLEGLIDFEKEKQRLEKEFEAVKNEIERIDTRLANPDFAAHAPDEEVQKARQRKIESSEKLERLKEHLSSVRG